MTTRALISVVVLAALFALAIPAVRHWRERPPAPPQPIRASWAPPAELTLGAGPDFPFGLALSPDGRRAVFPASRSGEVELWLQDLTSAATRALPGTDEAVSPFWSPDGSHIAFFANGRLRALDLASGVVADLADAPAGRGGAWSAAGDIVFAAAATGGLTLRRADGSLQAITTVDAAAGEVSHRWPAWLDDGRHVVFLGQTRAPSRGALRLAALEAPGPSRVLTSADGSAIVRGRTVLYASGDALVAQHLDAGAGQLVGRAALVGVGVGTSAQQELMATSGGDVLIFAPPPATLRTIVRVTREGVRQGEIGGPVDSYDLRLSRDGRRVAVTERDPQLASLDVFVYDLRHSVPTARLSRSVDVDESVVWSPDGTQLAWLSGRRAVTIRGAGATLPEEVVIKVEPPARITDWTPDRRWMLLSQRGAGTGDDIWAVPMTGTKDTLVPIVRSAFNDVQGIVSPDGRWMAWAADDAGRFEVYADRFPKPAGRIKLTAGGGADPRWRSDGAELYFRRGSAVHVVELGYPDGTIEPQATTRLFEAGGDVRAYDASADGRWFVVNVPADPGASRPATLVVNWQSVAAEGEATRASPAR